MIQNLIFGVYLLLLDFLVETLKDNKNYQKRSVILWTVPLKKLTSFYEPQFNIVKNIIQQENQKPTHFTNFPANMFLVGVRKNICTAPRF